MHHSAVGALLVAGAYLAFCAVLIGLLTLRAQIIALHKRVERASAAEKTGRKDAASSAAKLTTVLGHVRRDQIVTRTVETMILETLKDGRKS